jgi:hypothetical protein
MSKLVDLRNQWEAKGNPPCDHPTVDKEYDLGGQTGDLACTVCGECPVERPAPRSDS